MKIHQRPPSTSSTQNPSKAQAKVHKRLDKKFLERWKDNTETEKYFHATTCANNFSKGQEKKMNHRGY